MRDELFFQKLQFDVASGRTILQLELVVADVDSNRAEYRSIIFCALISGT